MDVLKLCVYFIVLSLLHIIMVTGAISQRNTTINTYEMHQLCGQTINMKWKSIYTAEVTFDFDLGGRVNVSHHAPADRDKYSLPVVCALHIESWNFWDRLMIVFEELSMEASCADTYLEVLDGSDSESPPLKGLPSSLCNHHVTRVLSVPYVTSDKHLTISVHGNPGRQHKLQFTFVVVAFHEGSCRSYEYSCPSGRCIMDDLVCNGHNPCGDNSDCAIETDAPREVKPEENGALVVALAALSASIVALLVGVVVFLQCYRRRRKHLRQQQYHSAYGGTRNEMQISVAAASQLERSVSQIEAERRLAPPSYSTLEARQEENQSESGTGNEQSDEDDACSCMEPDNESPPSYACVMSHQDDFKLSDLDLRRSKESDVGT